MVKNHNLAKNNASDYFLQFLTEEQKSAAFEMFNVTELFEHKSIPTPKGPIYEIVLDQQNSMLFYPAGQEVYERFIWLNGRPKGVDAIFAFKQIPKETEHLIIFNRFDQALIFNALQTKESKFFGIGFFDSSFAVNMKILEAINKFDYTATLLFSNSKTAKNRASWLKRFGFINYSLPVVESEELCYFSEYLLLEDVDILNLVYSFILLHPLKKFKKKTSKYCQLLEIEELLEERSNSPIDFPTPLLTIGEVGIIYPFSLNVIQGKMGSFKSSLGSVILTSIVGGKNNLGLIRTHEIEKIQVVLVDTERNLEVELPRVIRTMKDDMGDIGDNTFRATSIKNVNRRERQTYLKSYIEGIKEDCNDHIVFLLDVITDCISEFNDLKESFELIDLLSSICEENNCTVIAIIHENPNSGKARGHLGTELGNKASSLISIGFPYNNKNIVKIDFQKNRSNKKAEPILCKYDDTVGNLRKLTQKESQSFQSKNASKAKMDEVVYALMEIMVIGEVVEQALLIEKLTLKEGVAKNTIKKRLDAIIEEKVEIAVDAEENTYILKKMGANGKKTTYYLEKKEEITNNVTYNTDLAYD
jgi:hypothetical protein